jgi:Asp-tRNA(Asn)/Glu-tRNA(Gln) amidotransferase A subunit family amidase
MPIQNDDETVTPEIVVGEKLPVELEKDTSLSSVKDQGEVVKDQGSEVVDQNGIDEEDLYITDYFSDDEPELEDYEEWSFRTEEDFYAKLSRKFIARGYKRPLPVLRAATRRRYKKTREMKKTRNENQSTSRASKKPTHFSPFRNPGRFRRFDL